VQTFRDLDKHLGLLPAQLVNSLATIEAGRGRQEVFKSQRPMILETLRDVAVIQSVEASNAIENITAPTKRIRDLALDKTTPKNRSEAEIAGYRRVLDEIHTNASNIPVPAERRPRLAVLVHRPASGGVQEGREQGHRNPP